MSFDSVFIVIHCSFYIVSAFVCLGSTPTMSEDGAGIVA